MKFINKYLAVFLFTIVSLFSVYFVKGADSSELHDEFSNKEIHYEFVDTLPETEKQILVCNDDSKIWLELTNFEFLINHENGDRLVKVYVGDVGDKNKATREPIGIFDPDLAFIFEEAVTDFYKNSDNPLFENPISELKNAVKHGYSVLARALTEDSGLPLEDKNVSSDDIRGFLAFCEFSNKSLIEKYKEYLNEFYDRNRALSFDNTKLDRLVNSRFITKKVLEKRIKQGLVAYYTKPKFVVGQGNVELRRNAGLNDENFVYRLLGMSDNYFFKHLIYPYQIVVSKDCNYISKFSNVRYNRNDIYDQILYELYPENAEIGFRASDFKRVRSYVFRGDGRSIDRVFSAGGFWPNVPPFNESPLSDSMFFDNTKDKIYRQLLNNKDLFKYRYKGGEVNPYSIHTDNTAYVATSKYLVVAERYAKSQEVRDPFASVGIYFAFSNGGIRIPTSLRGKPIVSIFYAAHEISAPGGIAWKSITGVVEAIGGSYSGPLFLKAEFVENDRENFWKIINLYSSGRQEKINSDVCLELGYQGAMNNLPNKNIKKYMGRIIWSQTQTTYNPRKI